MESRELELKYEPHLTRVGGLLLLPAAQAIDLLDDLRSCDVQLLGVEAFRLFEDGGVQPSMEFSNISFGIVDDDSTFYPDLRPREPWDSDPDLVDHTQELIRKGAANGYEWFEVTLQDIANQRVLFFDKSEPA